jgi:hypothetical protein
VVVLVHGTVTHQILADQVQAVQVLRVEESTAAVQHSLFKVIRVAQTLEIPELAVAIMVLPVVTVACIMDQDNTPLAVVAAQAVLVA